MKVGVLAGSGVALVDRPVPTLGDGEVLVDLAACGICGTDLEKLRGNYQSAGILGHEPVGRVAAVGKGVETIAVGDRVFVHHHVPCYGCPVCGRGEYTYCPSYSKSNIDPGGFAEHFRVPEANVRRGAVLRLGPSVSWEVGTLLEPAGCALTALRKVGFHAADSVFVIGLGPVGLLYAALAKCLGAWWVGGTDLSARRREAAGAFGVDATFAADQPDGLEAAVREATGGLGVDLAVAAVGAPTAVRLAARLPRRGGTLNLFGLPERGSRLDHDLQDLYLRGIRVFPTYATTERDIADVHQLVTTGRVALGGMVTGRYPLDRIADAFAAAARTDAELKVVVTGPGFDSR
ncbi:MAG TPA: alcohol dehydrogenase catalytic domain-containing protein [Thermoplasmata archaeon]|nr:alcohol dehydrogenase catalytic domain-containing protein [Thermoplasmata archaeon]